MPEKQNDESKLLAVLEVLKDAKTRGPLNEAVKAELAKLLSEETRAKLVETFEAPVTPWHGGQADRTADAEVRELTPEKQAQLFSTLEARFNSKPEHYKRVEGVSFTEVEKSLEADPALIYSFARMEETGGEPDIIAVEDDAFIFADCSKESPTGRRNCVYDKESEKDIQTEGFNGNAVDMAQDFGVELMDESAYMEMQKSGEFDSNTWSWFKTPADFRETGCAFFGYRHGAEVVKCPRSAYSHGGGEGWRGWLRVPKA